MSVMDLQSPTTQLFGQQIVRVNIEENIKAPVMRKMPWRRHILLEIQYIPKIMQIDRLLHSPVPIWWQ